MKRLLLVFAIGCQTQMYGTTSTSTTPSTGSSPEARTDDRASGASNSAIITVPDTVGKNQAAAEAALRAAGVTGEIKLYNDPGTVDFSVATVCQQSPGGGQQTRASLHVVLRYCQPDRVTADTTPVLTGLTLEEAKKRARAAGHTGPVRVVDAAPGACKLDTVCRVEPYTWAKEGGGELTLFVARATPITMPD